ncbi:MAG: RNA polymerase sigma-70 factor [Gemmatimonadaceae bacterium]
MDDRALLQKIQAGDEGAYDAAFRTWYPVLVRVSNALLQDADAAEEVAQEVMLELWRRRHALDANVTLGAYLLRSVRNRSLNHLRHLKVRRRSEADVEALYESPVAADQPIVAQELAEAARQAVAQLPPRCREIFELSRVHGLRYAQIAETLDISQKTVEAQMGKALKILRERLAPWLPKGDDL